MRARVALVERRLTSIRQPSSPKTRAAILQRIYSLVSVRDDSLCNFVDLPPGFGFGETGEKEHAGDDDLRVIYRHYATLYFVFVVDQSESELGILDLIQVRHALPESLCSPSLMPLGVAGLCRIARPLLRERLRARSHLPFR